MGSPLSPVITIFYMEKFKQSAFQSTSKKPSCRLHYTDDTFDVWNHGEEELGIFLAHINNIHPSSRLTMVNKDGG